MRERPPRSAGGCSPGCSSSCLLGARSIPGTIIWGAPGARGVRTSILVFAVLLVHSLPEGFAIGTAYASDTAGLSLFVIVAIVAVLQFRFLRSDA